MPYNCKLVCYDMDGTLITNTNSVRFLCNIANKIEEVIALEIKEEQNMLNWIEADYYKAKLLKGVNSALINNEFDNYIKLIDGIENVINSLNEKGIHSILVTAGPIQVAEVLGKRFNFDAIYGSDYEILDNHFTGEILHHLRDEDKLKCLEHYCGKNNIALKECVAVGDSSSDIKVFEKCEKSIALNYSDTLLDIADIYINSNDLNDILKHIK